MATTHSGHCLCGAVHYSFSGDPAVVALCHCDDCQRQSGSAFSVNVGVGRDSVTIDYDQLQTIETVGTDTGQPRKRMFCGKCGSPILTLLSEMPDLAFIKAGTLDDRETLAPQIEVWRERAQGWVPDGSERAMFPRDLQQEV
jgi:hypothetical protein